MKVLIASDIHGSAAGCVKLLEAYEREGAGRLLLLGDLLSHEPSGEGANSVERLLEPLKDSIECVRGNCDTAADLARLPFPVKEGYTILPVVGDSGFRMVYATHGHIYNSTHLPSGMRAGDILLHGHTHVPETVRQMDRLIFCPGAVGRPRWGSQPGYMTMEGTVFLWKTLAGEEYRRYEL